ncbi:asparagine synthase C-terminal domain-containing protein [Candidatus Nitrosotenuis aquarius]|uniref:asparagine synthase-related protein n=1 Tax=Candidatus Nitrosotenuis aquarius TaxID=1846278 RepID=UPI000C1F2C8A|nr:asparagine synthase C-terminal domain-containing protein [Candidatus Nitrosotenuis aquarius]
MVRSRVNPKLIKHILTLRYSTEIKSKIPKLSWKDFVEKEQNISADQVEKIIISYVKDNIENSARNKIALALSGGIDSTLVLSSLIRAVPNVKIKTLSVKFAESFDETKQSSKLAERLGVDNQIIFVSNYLKNLPAAISIVKLPIWDLHWYHVAKKASSISKFIVSGDGGDELFGGYTFRYKKFLSLIKKNTTKQNKILSYLKCHERDWVTDQPRVFGKNSNFSWKEIYNVIEPYFGNPLNPLNQVFLADFNGKLRHNFSVVNTAINKHFGIKTLTPLLSEEMISYATHIPSNMKYDKQSKTGKIILRQIIKKENLERFVSQGKQGFSIDTVNLWKSYGKEICDYYLYDARIIQDGWINREWIRKKLKIKDTDARTVNKLYGLLAFEIWYKLFITKELKHSTRLV